MQYIEWSLENDQSRFYLLAFNPKGNGIFEHRIRFRHLTSARNTRQKSMKPGTKGDKNDPRDHMISRIVSKDR
jgi:hypothetical protein